MRMRFHFCPLSRAFSNRCGFDEYTQRFSVDRRPKRIEMYTFSNENALVWTGLDTVLPRLLVEKDAKMKRPLMTAMSLFTNTKTDEKSFSFLRISKNGIN